MTYIITALILSALAVLLVRHVRESKKPSGDQRENASDPRPPRQHVEY